MKRALENTEDDNPTVSKRQCVEERATRKTTVKGVLLNRYHILEVELDADHLERDVHAILHLNHHECGDYYRGSDDMEVYVRSQANAGLLLTTDERLHFRTNSFAMRILSNFFPGVADEKIPIDGPALVMGRDGRESLTETQIKELFKFAALAWPKPDEKPLAWAAAVQDKQLSIDELYRSPCDEDTLREYMLDDKPWAFVGYSIRSLWADHEGPRLAELFTPADEEKAKTVFQAYWRAAAVPGYFGLVIEWLSTPEPNSFGPEELAIIKTLLGSDRPEDRNLGTWTHSWLDTRTAYDERKRILYYDESRSL